MPVCLGARLGASKTLVAHYLAICDPISCDTPIVRYLEDIRMKCDTPSLAEPLRCDRASLAGQKGGTAECTKIARFSAVAAAIFTAPGKIARFVEAPSCAISSVKKITSEPRFFLR